MRKQKWFKRLLTSVTAASLLLGMLTMGAFAAEGTFKEIVEAAADGGVITLTGDVQLTELVSIEKNLTIDLNGHTLANTGSGQLRVNASRTVTIQNGRIEGKGNGAILYAMVGTLNLNTLNMDGSNILEVQAGDVNIQGCTLNTEASIYMPILINGGQVTLSGGTSLMATASMTHAVIRMNGGNLVVRDATVHGVVGPAIRLVGDSAHLVVEQGAQIRSDNQNDRHAIEATAGTITVRGETVRSGAVSLSPMKLEGNAQVVISGGTFNVQMEGANVTLAEGCYWVEENNEWYVHQDPSSCSHDWSEWDIDEATCTANGIRTHTCTICNTIENEIIPATGHTWGEWISGETSHWHECTVCGAKGDEAAHTEDEGVVTIEPTETTEGERTFTCTVCDYT